MLEIISRTALIPDYSRGLKDTYERDKGGCWECPATDEKDLRQLRVILTEILKDPIVIENIIKSARVCPITFSLRAVGEFITGTAHLFSVIFDSYTMKEEYRSGDIIVQKCIGLCSPETIIYKFKGV